jgi:protein-tyrosine-phosphatase
MNVLFVCHANTSRSIMAETLLRAMLAALPDAAHVQVSSAGVAPYARDGALVSLDTRFALRDHGHVLPDEKTSTDLKRNLHLLEQADVVLAMTTEQRAIVERMAQAKGKLVFTLREFAGETVHDIPDPASRDESFFRETCSVIRNALEVSLPRLLELARAESQ